MRPTGHIRILACTLLLANVLWEDLASVALLPSAAWLPQGIMARFPALPGADVFLASAPLLTAFKWLTAALLVLGITGWRRRYILPLAVMAALIFGGIIRSYTVYYHVALVPIYVLLVLAFWPGPDDWKYYACLVVIALPYTAAGLSKLRDGGLLWWHADNMRSIIYTDALSAMQFDTPVPWWIVDAPDWIFALLGLGGLVGELGYISVLFSRRARCIFPLLLLGMHTGIVVLQGVLFYDLMALNALLAVYARHEHPIIPAGRRGGLLVANLAAVALLGVVMRVEWYPVSNWTMYASRNMSGTITYYRVVGVDPAKAIGVLKDTRYRAVLPGCFSGEERCAGVLGAAVRAAGVPRATVERYTVSLDALPYSATSAVPESQNIVGADVFARR